MAGLRAEQVARRIAALVGDVGIAAEGWERRAAERLGLEVESVGRGSPVPVAVLGRTILVREGEGEVAVLAGVVSAVAGGSPGEVRAAARALVNIFFERVADEESPVSSVG